jgi:hypothetical protein
MSWKRFYRRECPVCGGTRKDCRQSTTTGLIHCRELEANPPNFIFRGYDALGFGMWADKVDAEAWTEEKRQELQEIRRRERRAEQARRMRLLSESERDRTMRSILSQLSLSEKHRTHLRERGLSDEQIEAGLYRSVNQWQKLLWPVDDRLAGVSLGGNGLCIPAAGILCPIANHKEELLGWQVRFDNPGDLPKYLWASPEKSRRKNGPSVHLKNGELPLAFFNPVGKPHKVVSRCGLRGKIRIQSSSQ